MNIIDVMAFVRIVASICILISTPFSPNFFRFYSFCGIADVADGIIARRLEYEKERGAKLDGIADIIFAIIIVAKVLPALKMPFFIIIWIVIIVAVRFLGEFMCYKKYKKCFALHTYTNKLTEIVIFIFPFFYRVTNTYILEIILCVIASISTVEELIIIIRSKRLKKGCKSMFDKDKF